MSTSRVLKTCSGGRPSTSAASSPKDRAPGSCSYTCWVKGTSAAASATVAGVPEASRRGTGRAYAAGPVRPGRRSMPRGWHRRPRARPRARHPCRGSRATSAGLPRGGCRSGRSRRTRATAPRSSPASMRGAVVLAPERHPALGLVRLGLVHPALADERHVADDARGREAGQVAHDRLLQVLGLLEREPPVLGERDHVAHVEVVRGDRRLVLQREAEVEQRLGGVVDATHQHALVAHVAHAGVEHRPGGLRHERGDRLGAVDVGVDGERDTARAGLGADPGHALDDVVLQPVLGQAHERLGREPDVADVVDLEQLVEEPLEVLPRHVGHVATGDDDVAHLGRAVQVVEHRGVAVDRLAGQLELGELRASSCRPGPSACSGRSTAGRSAASRPAPWWGSGG